MPKRPTYKRRSWIVPAKPFDHSKGWEQNPFYNSTRWRKVRKIFIQNNPLCKHCKDNNNRVVPATDVDHVVPLRISPERSFDFSNLQSLCRSCHAKKSAEDGRIYPKKQNKKTNLQKYKLKSSCYKRHLGV